MATKHDTTILDSSAKKVRVALKDITDVEHLNALLDCEENDFEKPRSTVISAINERIAALVVDADADASGSDASGSDDSNDDSGSDDSDDSGDNSDGADLDDDAAPAKTAKPRVKRDLTTGPARLGKTARLAFEAIKSMSNPPAPMVPDESDDAEEGAMVPETDDDGVLVTVAAVFPTAGEIANKLGVKTSQVRSILRTLRGRLLVSLLPALTPEDRTYRYQTADGAVERIADGDAARTKTASGATRKAVVKVDPMLEEEYAPLARKVGTLDRLIVRWSGTSHRERRAIDKEHGDDASKVAENWSIVEIELDGVTVKGTAKEIVGALRVARNAIMSDAAFNAAQAVEEGELLTVVEAPVTNDDAAPATTDGDSEE